MFSQTSCVSLPIWACIIFAKNHLVISIPVAVLWRIKLSRGKKLALASLLCLSVFTVIVNILSVAVPAAFASVVWSFFTTSLEASIAVTAASMNAFRIIFTKDRHTSYSHELRQGPVQQAETKGRSRLLEDNQGSVV